MSRDPKQAEVDLEGLLEAVHGRTDESRREQQIDDALRAIESTHRAASVAVRNFERHGRLEAEASVLLALGALADDSQAPPPAPGAEATTVGAVPAKQEVTVAAAAPGTPADAAPAPSPSAEATAIYRPQPLSDEATAAPARAAVASDEVTQTSVAPLGELEPTTAPATSTTAPSAPAPAVDEAMRPARVYSGRGKDVVQKEITRTNVIRRPKA